MADGEIPTQERGGKFWIWVVILILVLAVGGYVVWFYLGKNSGTTVTNKSASAPSATAQKASWREKGVAVAGQYADADVVTLDNGQYRMYYGVEPEVKGNNLEIYSSISTDGINWTKEDGIRKTMATFPDVIKLSDGTWRMYFQNAGVIKSATSSDGLVFKDDTGVRLDKNEAGFDLESVGAQSTTILSDRTYLMLYRGTINQPYQTTEKVPNNNTQLYFWATSKDGLTFEKKGVAIDSRNDTLFGLTDGAEFVKWDSPSELRVYFWSYRGIYHVTYSNGKFSQPTFDFTNNPNTQVKFAPDPPGDPTLIKINNTWYMYYGQHTKGIYYATLSV